MHNWKAKKLLALLLSIVMVLGLLPMSALAADTTETADAPITVTAGGKACTLEQIENESYLIYRVVFYPEQDITITPADENNNVTLRSLSSMLIYDRAGNAMENLDSATLPADMIEQNKMDADQLASLPGYVEVENTQYASVITVDVKDSEDAVVAQAVLYLVTVEAPAVVPVDTLELSQNELTLTEGETATLTATVGPENATDKTVTWTVEGDAATVKDGVVTAVKAGEAIVTATSGSATASCKVTVSAPKVTSIKITHAPTKTVYTAGESFNKTGMTVTAVYDDDTTAPVTDFTVEGGESLTADVTKVTVKSGAFTAEQPITVLPASSAYELRVLTFEDADYKGGTNFAGGNDWTSLIDDPQYGGKLLYGEGNGFSSLEEAYTWADANNTWLTSTLCNGYGSWCYWSGGHAVSNYASGDIAAFGGHDAQLTVYKKDVSGLTRTGGGHNGSDNFAVHYGYMDGSQYNMTEVLPSISFADGVSRVIDSMYVTNTTYALNCYIDGNGLTAKIGDDDWVKLVATGYDEAGTKTGETSIYLCNGPDDIVMDWTKFDLSVLGKVAKVEFNVTGSSDNGYGFSQPAYFAYDDVVVRFEKPVPATAVTLDKSALSLTEGETAKLTATVQPEDTTDTLIWSTSNDKVATVKDGTVTAVAAGTATITATCGSFKAECTVTVKAPAAAPISVKVGETACPVTQVGDLEDPTTLQYRAVVPYGSDVTIEVADASFLMVTDSNDNYINEEGVNPFSLTAAQLEALVVTGFETPFTPAAASKIAIMSIIDATAGTSYYLYIELTREAVPATSVTLDKTELTLKPTEKTVLTATVAPENTTDTLVWTSSDETVATVKDGTVTAKKAGTTTITATCGSVKAECAVTVTAPIEATGVKLSSSKLALFTGDVAVLTAEVEPADTTDKTVIWTSSKPEVASVANGTITALTVGETVVTATCGRVKAECTVTVTDASQPELKDGVYQIATASNLVWFAKQVNGGNTAISGVLTDDIDLTGINWTPIGSYTKPFAGSFDGAGHTIKNLTIDYATAKASERVYLGLFGNVEGAKDAYAVIKDLTVEGTVRASSSYSVYSGSVGGVVGSGKYLTLTGVIARVNVSVDENVGKACSVGGVAGLLTNCTMTSCGNEAAVSGVQNVGGLVGWFYAGTMTGCYNTGSVTGTALGVGGITGYAKNAAITNVYNTGAASTTRNQIGGLIGVMEKSTLTNAYTTGKITVSETGGNAVGAAVGWADTLSNVFYLEGTAATGVGRDGTAEVKTAAELKGLAAALGEGFKNDAGNVNDGYPVLVWQVSNAPDPVITGIKITNAPTKTVYEAGESFDAAGMTVAAVYDDDSEIEITDYTVVGGENLTVGTTKVTVQYTVDGKTFSAEQAITVNAAETEMKIYTADDLVSFANKVKAGKTSLKGILMANIDMTEVTDFVGVGTYEQPYAGELDGGSFSVTVDIHAGGTVATHNSVGIIAYAGDGAYIHDVTLKGIIGAYNGGGVVGCTVSGETKIANCVNYAVINGSNPNGGILGEAKGKVTILDCVNYGEIGSVDKTGMTSYGGCNGGIVGRLAADGCVIENSANHGELVDPSGNRGNYANVAGIVGEVAGSNCVIRACYNDAKVSAQKNVGGIAGTTGYGISGLTIESCYNAGEVYASSVSSNQRGVAGILASADGATNVKLTDVYNVGKITIASSTASVAGIGGIVGYINRTFTVENAYNAGTIAVTGTAPHGSVLGYVLSGTSCTVTNCYWLTGTDEKMYSGTSATVANTDIEASTADELKELYTALGNGFKKDAGKVNSGYPVLDWQESVGEPEIVSIKITHAPYKTNYTAGESFDKTGMTVAAVYDNGTTKPVDDFTVENGENLTAGTASVTVKSGAFTAAQPITVFAASDDYEICVLTFEDADYKGGVNFAGGNDWSSLIDDPQYGGSMLYPNGSGTTDESEAYTWTDTNNTWLYHMLPKSWDNYCYWGGGHAVSHYVTSDFETYGDFNHQLTVYNKDASTDIGTTGGGHNGSDNFAVHFGYKDNSGYTDSQILPSISFADGVARVVDHMYVNNITYALNCYLNGNGLTAKIDESDWVKLTATGYDANGTKTGDAEIYLCNGPDNIITDWTKFDLSGLGKVQKIEFNITGSSDNGYGFSQPAYFAYDDVAVQFEKTSAAGLLGDVNGDGKVTAKDAALLYAYINGRTTLTDEQLALCDVSGDGKVTAKDAALIYAFVNGRITKFPAEE